MLPIQCPHCGNKGQVDETRFTGPTRTLRCPGCKQTFVFDRGGQTTESTGAPTPPGAMSGASSGPPSTPPLTLAPPSPTSPPGEPPRAPDAGFDGEPLAVCASCGNTFSQNEMVRFGTNWVCANCKPGYVRRVREGGTASGEMRYAGFWIRVGAKLIDGLILGVAILVPIIIAFILIFKPYFLAPPGKILPPPRGEIIFLILGLVYILPFVIMAAYTIFFLGSRGATPGKKALKLKVVRSDGSPLTYGRATGRFFADILSGQILLIGYLMAAWDKEKRTLHDHICDTRVIRN